MATNKYFRPFTYGREQDTAEDLIIESIKIYGIDLKYMPRTIIGPDTLLGEDPLSEFNDAIDIEMYIKNTQQFEGEGDFLSKFNLEIRDQITFVMARKRWEQVANEKVLTEVGYNIQLEEANTKAWANSVALRAESGGLENYQTNSPIPFEGDFVYFPLNNKLYEIKFVEHESLFYQTGTLQVFDMRCDLIEFSGQRFQTGRDPIDTYFETIDTTETTTLQALANTDAFGSDDLARNYVFETEADNILDFSEADPFSENISISDS